MLERLILDSFQQHAHQDIRLEPVTTFVGPSQRGKSSILRALRWIGLNQPFGARFATWGTEAVSASLKIDGRWVARKWSPKENCYELDGVPYFSLKAPSVPETIACVLNLDPLHFQLQFDPPFWLFETAGEVSRRLNEVVNLEDIDRALAEAASAVKRGKANVELCTERLALAEKNLTDLAWVRDADEDLKEMEAILEQVHSVNAEINDLTNHIGDIRDLDDRIKELEPVIREGEELLSVATQLRACQSECEELRELVAGLQNAEETIRQTDGLERDWKALSDAHTACRRASEDRRDLDELVTELRAAEETIWQSDQTVQAAVAELQRATKGRCPTCGQPADASRVLLATPISASAVP